LITAMSRLLGWATEKSWFD